MTEKSILLVEDDYMDIINFQRFLSKLDKKIPLIVTHNGREAIDLLREAGSRKLPELPAVILLDLNMPKMNGIEFLRELRSDSSLKKLKVFVLTTSKEEVDKTQANELGIEGYIIKPFTYESTGDSLDNFNLFMELLKMQN